MVVILSNWWQFLVLIYLLEVTPVRVLSRVSCCVVCVAMIPLSGCGKDTTPKGPEVGEIQQYLDEHPEAANREDEVEPDDDSGEG